MTDYIKIDNSITPAFQATYPFRQYTWQGRTIIQIKIILFPLFLLDFLFKKIVLSLLSPYLFGSKKERARIFSAKRESLGGESLILRTPDSRLIEANYISADKSNNQVNPQKVVILFTGSHYSYEYYAPPMLEAYKERGYDVLCINYGGFGLSKGNPSEKTLQLDAETAYQYIHERKNIDNSQIIAHGYSLGAYPATYLCSQYSIGNLVFDRGFSKMSRVVQETALKIRKRKWLSQLAYILTEYTTPLNNEDLLTKVKGKILLVAGKYDFNFKHHIEILAAKLNRQNAVSSMTMVELPIRHENDENTVWFSKLKDTKEKNIFDIWIKN